jgi:hypothetical protein
MDSSKLNVTTAHLATGVLDTDLSSVSASDDTLPSAKATKAYADLKIALTSVSGTATASGDLAAGDYINLYLDGATLKMRQASCSTPYRADGFVLAAVGNTVAGTFYVGINNSSKTGLTVGSDYYLSTAGGVTTTAPTTATYIVQRLGKAISATAIAGTIAEPITL